jgi:protein-tyrosine phosphatase
VAIDHLPLTDLMDNQDDLILAAAAHIHDLVGRGISVGIYCMAGVSRTSTVAIAYLMLCGLGLTAATDEVRRVRPQALPAMQLWRSLERLEKQMAN